MEQIKTIQTIENLRGLGGYEANGKQVKSQRLLRSASLEAVSDSDSEVLAEYGVATVVDFRSPEERQQEPDQKIGTSQNLFMPVFAVDETQNSLSIRQLAEALENGLPPEEQMIKVYRHFVTEPHSLKTYQEFFAQLLSQESGAILFHCTAGKDRTGFAAAMILAALGVSQETIMADYLATNQFLSKKIQHIQQRAQEAHAPEKVVQGILTLMEARESFLAASLQQIQADYGTITDFLSKGLQLSAGDRTDLQRLYLEG